MVSKSFKQFSKEQVSFVDLVLQTKLKKLAFEFRNRIVGSGDVTPDLPIDVLDRMELNPQTAMERYSPVQLEATFLQRKGLVGDDLVKNMEFQDEWSQILGIDPTDALQKYTTDEHGFSSLTDPSKEFLSANRPNPKDVPTLVDEDIDKRLWNSKEGKAAQNAWYDYLNKHKDWESKVANAERVTEKKRNLPPGMLKNVYYKMESEQAAHMLDGRYEAPLPDDRYGFLIKATDEGIIIQRQPWTAGEKFTVGAVSATAAAAAVCKIVGPEGGCGVLPTSGGTEYAHVSDVLSGVGLNGSNSSSNSSSYITDANNSTIRRSWTAPHLAPRWD